MTKYSDTAEPAPDATTAPSCDGTIKFAHDRHDRRHAVGFAGNWVAGAQHGSRALRRRLLAVLRRAHRVLGLKRDRLGLGTLGVGSAVGRAGGGIAGNPSALIVRHLLSLRHAPPALVRGVVAPAVGIGLVFLGTIDPAAAQAFDPDYFKVGPPDFSAIPSKASGQNSIAIGASSEATGVTAVAVGAGSSANFNGAAAFGPSATAGGVRSTALGVQATTFADEAVAVGTAAVARANQAVAIGDSAEVGNGAVGAVTIGAGSQVFTGASGGLALGQNAFATNANDVALGSGSKTDVAVGTGGVTIAGTAYTFAGTAPGSTVSIGAVGAERTLTNVAAGRLSATSTDAVNGSQLFATNTAVDVLATAVSNIGTGKYFHANSTLADSTATGADSVAIGPVSTATAANSVSIGNGAVAGDAGAVALGAGSTTAAAVGTASTVIGGTTYGFAGVAPGSTVSVGAPGAERTITNVAAGRLSAGSTDAVNGSQLFATNQAVDSVVTTVNNVATTANNTAAIVNNINNGAGIKYFHANSALGDSAAVGTESVAIGPISSAAGFGAVALGAASKTTADAAVALGLNATAGEPNAVALGAGSVTAAAVGTGGITIAGKAYTFAGAAPGSTVSVGAVGAERTITNVAAGRLSATSTDAINGSQLFATNTAVDILSVALSNINNGGGIKYFHANSTLADSTATGTDSVAIGPVAAAVGTNAVSIGNGATASNANDVALGAGSVTSAAVGTAGVTLAGKAYTFAGATPGSTVSVGAVGAERTITNVAAGRLSATSTDAVNGSQLFATNTAVDVLSVTLTNITNGGGIKYFHTNSTLADSTATGTNSVAIGPVAAATGANAVSIGNGAKAGNAGDVALGAGSVTDKANPTAGITIAGKSYTFAGGAPTSVVSVGAPGAERQITNVAAGRVSATSTDAINGSQLFATNQAVESVATTVNNINNGGGIKYFHANSTLADSTASGTDSVAVGPLAASSATNAVSMGNGASASANNAIAIGAGAKATQANSLALGAGSTTTANLSDAAYAPFVGTTVAGVATGEVSVGATGAERRVTNVAAGASPTDAVNVSQLQAVAKNVTIGSVRYDTDSSGNITNRVTLSGGTPGAAVNIGNVAPGINGTDAVNVDQLNGAVGSLNRDIKKARREAWRAAAIGLAAASLRYDDRPGKISAAIGGGMWRGEGAYSMGLGFTAQNGWVRGNLSATTSGGNWGIGIGATFTLN